MNEECLICGAPLEYLDEDVEMECELCRKKERSRTRCVNGHYVCSECHMQGTDRLAGLCLRETSKNPAVILNRMMAMPFCHMHGPEHHIMVGMALLTAYRNAGGKLDLKKALAEMNSRGRQVPGGACGFWGACGAGISTRMFVSIATGSTPLGEENFGLSHKMTSRALGAIGEVEGPRCCKRDSYLSILEAVDFAEEYLGISMERPKIRAAPTAARITSASESGARSAKKGRRSRLSASTTPAEARLRRPLGNSICRISATAFPREQR